MQPRPHASLSLALPALLLLACVPPKGDLGEYTATTTSGGTGESSGPGEGTTTGSSGGTSIGSDSSTHATGDPEPYPAECSEPSQPSWESANFSFNPPVIDGPFTGTCEITGTEQHPGDFHLLLDCGETTVQIELQLDEPLPDSLTVGAVVELDYRAVLSFNISEWFTLRRPAPDGALLLAGLNAGTFGPPDAPDFFAPLSMSVREGLCPQPVDCDDAIEILAVEFVYGEDSALVFPLHSAVLGDEAPLRVGVSLARRHYQDLPDGQGGFCHVTDVPPYFYRLMMRPPSE